MNIELMKKVRDKIAAEPAQFKMTSWATISTDFNEYGVAYAKLLREAFAKNACGTTCCIAGWAVALADKSTNWLFIEDAAAELLGLNEDGAPDPMDVFYACNWPRRFINMPGTTADRAVAYLSHLIDEAEKVRGQIRTK